MGKGIKIGWAKRSIAPEKGASPITGQFYLRVSQGVYTPVLTHALVLENGDDAVIFLSADMVCISSQILMELKDTLSKENPEIPVEKIIANATHTHAGPSDMAGGKNPDGKPSYPLEIDFLSSFEVRAYIVRQMADAILEAWSKREAGSVAYGYGFAVTGHSRRTIYLDDIGLRQAGKPGLCVNGHGKMYGNTNDEMFDCYEAGTDAFINLLYTFDKDGKLTGAIVNVPCPSQTGEHAWMLHASFWHKVREKLYAKYGEIGVLSQAAAAGDLSPRQLHYRAAEHRRYRLKYADKIAEYIKNPMVYPEGFFEGKEQKDIDAAILNDAIEWMRAEDISNRIVAAFDEVLSWAAQEKFSEPELRHEVKTVQLARRKFTSEIAAEEAQNYETVMKEEFVTEGNKIHNLISNSRLNAQRSRCKGVADRYAIQEKEPFFTADIHAVRIGNVAFASNHFELFIDFMHRIQARSPFEQTFIVQLASSIYGHGGYLATARATANKGYSASPYCNRVSAEGGQQLVNETLAMLEDLKK